MAQVTMDSKEYIELLDKSRAWDNLNNRMVTETEIEIGDEHYNGYRINIAYIIPERARMEIARKVADAVVASDVLMQSLVKENATVLDVRTGYIGRSWGNEKAEDVDLRKFPEFKAKYEAFSKEEEE